jgi:hypothetical protein
LKILPAFLEIVFWKLVFSIDYGPWTIDFIGNCFLEIGVFHGLWSMDYGLHWKLFFVVCFFHCLWSMVCGLPWKLFFVVCFFHCLWSMDYRLHWKLFFGNCYFPWTMVYGLSTSLEIVFWKLVFSLLIGLTRVLRKHQGFGFSSDRDSHKNLCCHPWLDQGS